VSTHTNEPRRNSTTRSELGRYVPRRFNPLTRERFLRDRRRRYLARVPANAPTDAQASLIQTLATLEWAALSAEHEGGLQALREAREHRRLLQRLLGDFERSLVVKPPPPPSLAEVIARHRSNVAA
jgi:hypothetical protein